MAENVGHGRDGVKGRNVTILANADFFALRPTEYWKRSTFNAQLGPKSARQRRRGGSQGAKARRRQKNCGYRSAEWGFASVNHFSENYELNELNPKIRSG
jgi:hypothetical protein